VWVGIGIAVAVGVVVLLAFRDRATPADVSYDGPVGSEPGDPGLYFFDTVGFESVDALAGARHDYPDVTTVLVDERSCGAATRWEPLSQRSDEWRFCGPDGSVDLVVEFHEWFGFPETTETMCTGLRLEGDDRWQAACSRPDTAIDILVEVIGEEVVVVGGQDVVTTHLRLVETTTGRTTGSRVTDFWMIPGTPLFARKQVIDRSTSSSPIGSVNYVEEYTLVLRSVTPTG
jgi:hypothetical protein